MISNRNFLKSSVILKKKIILPEYLLIIISSNYFTLQLGFPVDSLEKEIAILPYSCLENSINRKLGGLQSMG